MRQNLSRFRGMDKAQIKRALMNESAVVCSCFDAYEEFVVVAKDIPPRTLLECAKQLEDAGHLATYCHRRYIELTGEKEKYYAYLVRRMYVDRLRRDFPECVTLGMLAQFGRVILERVRGASTDSAARAYELLREAGDDDGMAAARTLAIERGHLDTIKECGIELDPAECLKVWRTAMAKRASSSDQIFEFLTAHGMNSSYQEFLEAVGRREGFRAYMVFCGRLQIRPSTKYLIELLKAATSPREQLSICSLLKQRNPKRWAGKERSIAAALRDEWLDHGEPDRAKRMAVLCGKPLTLDELLLIHQKYRLDNELMRVRADRALGMAAALIARRTRCRRNKAKAAA